MAPNKNTRKGRGRGNKPPTGESSAGATSTAPSSQHQLLQDAVSSVTSHATATASSTGTDDQSMLAMINSVMPDILPATREVAGGHYSFCGCTPK